MPAQPHHLPGAARAPADGDTRRIGDEERRSVPVAIVRGPPPSPLAALSARPFESLDDLIDTALRLMSDWIGIRLSMLHRLEGDTIVVSHVHDRMGLGIRPPVTVPRSATFCDTVLNTLQPLVVPDADVEPYRSLPAKQIVGTKTYIGVPIIMPVRVA